MIGLADVAGYRGRCFERGEGYLYLPAHPKLAQVIPCYTLTCPQQNAMTEGYTVLPTASASIVFSTGEAGVAAGLRGVNTRASVVGTHAVRYRMLLIVELHPMGLFLLTGIPQHELVDISVPLEAVSRPLYQSVLQALLAQVTVQGLVEALDRIFLSALADAKGKPEVLHAVGLIRASHGCMGAKALSDAVHYSEKQLGRLFRQQLGTGLKTFSRIVRVNHAIHLLKAGRGSLASVAAGAGYFDQAHFIHDFKALCGVNPQAYLAGMSFFYNDDYKM